MAYYNKQVIDIQTASGMSMAQSNEHQRNWTELGWKDAAQHGNYDPTRAHLNFEIGSGGIVKPVDKSTNIPQRIKVSLDSRGIVDPNALKIAQGKEPNRRTVVNIIFGGSRERMNRLAFGDEEVDLTHGADNSHLRRSSDIEGWAKDIYKFACDHWGEDNIVGFYVHLDETNPHIHCTVLPINAKNKFSFVDVFAGHDKLEFQERTRKLHDDLAKVNAKWGLIRGSSKYETGARHRTSEEYWADLRRRCDSLEIEHAGLTQEIDACRQTLADLQSEISKAERRVKGLTTMVSNLESKLARYEEDLDRLDNQIRNNAGDLDALNRQREKLLADIALTEGNLEDKKRKLRVADMQLASLKEKVEAARSYQAELRDQIEKVLNDPDHVVRMRLTDAVFGRVSQELQRLYPTLSPGQKNMVEGELLATMAEKPTELLRCALSLMIGYIDGAIQIAHTSGGGGGGGSDLKWGRDPDEDDRKWAFRCMMQANKMLRPTSGRRIKR